MCVRSSGCEAPFIGKWGQLSVWAHFHRCGWIKGCSRPYDPPSLDLDAPGPCSWGGWGLVPCAAFVANIVLMLLSIFLMTTSVLNVHSFNCRVHHRCWNSLNASNILCNIWSNHPGSSVNNNCYFLNADWSTLSRLSSFLDGSFK
jgi:hypothetical protein